MNEREKTEQAIQDARDGKLVKLGTVEEAMEELNTRQLPVLVTTHSGDKKAILPSEAIDCLCIAFAQNHDYARSWHDNIAVCIQDEGVEHNPSNRAAARFMKHAFGVDKYLIGDAE